MQVKTMLNSIEKHKSFDYGEARWRESKKGQELDIPVQSRLSPRVVQTGEPNEH